MGARRASALKALRRGGELVGLGFVLGDAHFHRAVLLRQLDHLRGLVRDGGRVPVGLHEEQGFAVERQADLREVLDAVNGGAVEELQRAGDDLGGDDVADGLRGGVHRAEGGDHRLLGGGLGDEFQQHLRHHAERAFAPDKEVFQRVAGHVFHALVTGEEDFAIGQNHFEAHDVVAGDAVFQAAQAAGVFRHVAADGGDLHRARVGRVEEADGRRRVCDGERGHARFDEHGEIRAVHFEDAVHPRGAHHDAIGRGQAAAAEARSGAARDDGGARGVGQLEDAHDLLRGRDEGHTAGHLAHRGGPVERVGDEVFLRRENLIGTDDGAELGEGGGGEGHRSYQLSAISRQRQACADR